MLFMNTSYWRAVEREMQTVPNFKPRRSGFMVNGVTLDRFRGYKNAAAKLLYRWKRNDITERIAAMYRKSGSFFADSDHKNFFAEFIASHKNILTIQPQKTTPNNQKEKRKKKRFQLRDATLKVLWLSTFAKRILS